MPSVPQLDVGDLGTILSVWAHPDDETYGCGAIMADATKRGQRVVCVTATRGERGSTDEARWPNGPDLARVRTAELTESLAVLGVHEHHWLDYADGGCAEVPRAEGVARVREILDAVQPDSVLCFGPDGGTWHPDHIATSGWATAAAAGTGARVLHSMHTAQWGQFMTAQFDPSAVMMSERAPVFAPREAFALLYEAEGELLDLKYRAMLRQESQVGPMLARLGEQNYRFMLAEEGFVPAEYNESPH
ncbi:MAG TPA: PIG-L family deacetylase [Jatrophihabitantaceae bacterium]|jgi:LmbE family N-acetylglucosaminyl deacetylase